MRCRSQTFCWTYPISARDLPHEDTLDAVKPAVISPLSPCVHRKGCFRGRSAVFCPFVHRKGCFRGRSVVFCPRVHPETVSDGQVFDNGVFSHSLVHAGAEGFSSDGSRSPPELLLSDGSKPVHGLSSQPHFPPPTKKEFIGYSRLCREITSSPNYSSSPNPIKEKCPGA